VFNLFKKQLPKLIIWLLLALSIAANSIEQKIHLQQKNKI